MIEGTLCSIKLGDQYPVRIMAVINLSRESFYKGSVSGPADALTRAMALVEEGADILDLGAVSTAPGAPETCLAEERERMMPVIKAIASNLEVGISVDTQRAAVAAEAFAVPVPKLLLPNGDESFGLRIGKSAQHHGVDHAEHGRVHAEPDG